MNLSKLIVALANSLIGMFRIVDIHQQKHLSVEHIKNIDLLATSTSIQVCPSDDELLLVELSGKVTKNVKNSWEISDQVSRKHQTIHITARYVRDGGFHIFSFSNVKMIVHVPRRYYDSIKVKTTSGSIKLDHVSSQSLFLKSSSGSIQSSESTAAKLYRMETSSGSIKALRNDAETMELSTNSGSIKADLQSADRMLLKTASGSIKARQLDGEVEARTSSGSIKGEDITMTGDWQLKSSSGSVSLQVNMPASLALHYRGNSGSGKVNINGMTFTQQDAHHIIGQVGTGDFRLNVQTSSGSFMLYQ
ncbi:hypothetical protein GCM10011391_24190 [Pullulanibacillus camelliae]|uniref:DUF4097 domain-containing protein n=1 Tax=Pullulanibacillus camelliae TaxID=1707096 RepID=A0A8J2YI18_9BACL|nr:DUF4097 family beta strand repeat-containing protein [Pullulanibacillus camelliae]GGE44557.1 hypothetical protein GCM10011391_24190 [Pullulanibacillus camelliae]